MSEQREFIRAYLSCGVDYYKGEKGDTPIKGVDYFTQEDIDEIVSQIDIGDIEIGDIENLATKDYVADAIAGIDLSGYATESYVDTAVAGIDLSDYALASDIPAVPSWAMESSKPSYTASEVGALPDDTALFSGSYNDLTDKPTLFSGNYNDLSNKPTLFSGSYDDLTNKPTIPAAYTLPTASTSTLGGVKVDGTTITISNGVISSVGGGGSDIVFNTTYDADTNKAATMADIDDAITYIELPASVITAGETEQHEPKYLNTVLYEMDTAISGKQDSLVFNTAYNASSNKVATMADIPAAYSLPTATTSTLGGVKVDGSTITISNGVISAVTSSSLPSNPSNDGTYFLKNVVSSGTATHGWESVIVGGSY